MKKHYLFDTAILFFMSYLYLWPFFERNKILAFRFMLPIFIFGLAAYLILRLLFRFERSVSMFGAFIFMFSGLEIVPMFAPHFSLFFGIYTVFFVLLSFVKMKKKVVICGSLAVLFSLLYVLSKINLNENVHSLIIWVIKSKVMVNFVFSILATTGLDYFLNDREAVFSNKYSSILAALRNMSLISIGIMLLLYAYLIPHAETKMVINIVNCFAWFSIFLLFGLLILFLKKRAQRLEVIILLYLLTIIDIFSFWQARFSLPW